MIDHVSSCRAPSGPSFFHIGRTAAPLAAYPSYGKGACKRTLVTGCLPDGFGCGRPRVWVEGGRGVVRNNSDQTALWA